MDIKFEYDGAVYHVHGSIVIAHGARYPMTAEDQALLAECFDPATYDQSPELRSQIIDEMLLDAGLIELTDDGWMSPEWRDEWDLEGQYAAEHIGDMSRRCRFV